MIGRLVAVRIEDVGSSLQVTGLVAQAKNRKAAWSFKVPLSESFQIAGYVEAAEADRKEKDKE